MMTLSLYSTGMVKATFTAGRGLGPMLTMEYAWFKISILFPEEDIVTWSGLEDL